MDAESLSWTLEEMTEVRPWPLRKIYQFYFFLCHVLRMDPSEIPASMPAFLRQASFKVIQTFLDIMEFMKTETRVPEDCQRQDQLEHLWSLIPEPLQSLYLDRAKSRLDQLRQEAALLTEFENSQQGREMAQLLDGANKYEKALNDDFENSQHVRDVVKFFNEHPSQDSALTSRDHAVEPKDPFPRLSLDFSDFEMESEAETQDQSGGGNSQQFPPPLGDISDCVIMDQNEKYYDRFNMYGREVILQLTGDVQDGLSSVTEAVISQYQPTYMVHIRIRSLGLSSRAELELSFQRADQVDPSLLFDQIFDILYDDELEKFFLSSDPSGGLLLRLSQILHESQYHRHSPLERLSSH